MKKGTTYKRAEAFALLLIGEPKSGKTTAALNFPRPFVLDLDNNLSGALRHHGEDFDMDTLYFENLEGVKPEKKWSAACKVIEEACNSPEIDTIVIDGISILAELLQTHILANTQRDSSQSDLVIAGEKCMQMNHWTPFKNLMSRLMMACKASGKKVVALCHEETLMSPSGAVIGYRPMIQGALKHNLAGYFTDVWRCETSIRAKVSTYKLRFAAKSMMQIGNSLGIKDVDYDLTDKTCKSVWPYLEKFFNK